MRPFLRRISGKPWSIVETNHLRLAVSFNRQPKPPHCANTKSKAPSLVFCAVLRQALQPIGNFPVLIVQAKRMLACFSSTVRFAGFLRSRVRVIFSSSCSKSHRVPASTCMRLMWVFPAAIDFTRDFNEALSLHACCVSCKSSISHSMPAVQLRDQKTALHLFL